MGDRGVRGSLQGTGLEPSVKKTEPGYSQRKREELGGGVLSVVLKI